MLSTCHAELTGILKDEKRPAIGPDGRIVLSTLRCGAAESLAASRVTLKYVAEGQEIYRYRGRVHNVTCGQFLAVPAEIGGEVEIGRSDGGATLGLCAALPTASTMVADLDEPMLFPAECSPLGRVLAAAHRQLRLSPGNRTAIAEKLLGQLVPCTETLFVETLETLDGFDMARPATRYEMLRRLNIARAYLHATKDRPVALSELAAVAGASKFHLLRNFRACFGQAPAAYHRSLRLAVAREAIDREELSCGSAAHRFGFADASSFSHAFRREFGRAPFRTRRRAPS